MVYLIINVAVIIAAGFMTRPANETTRDIGPLLSLADEVLISEKLGDGLPPITEDEPLMVVNIPRYRHSPDSGKIAPREFPSRDYPELMTEYTKELKAYLTSYFHVTPSKVEEME